MATESKNNWTKVSPVLEQAVKDVISKTAFDIQADYVQNAPRDTGFMVNSTHTVVAGDGYSATVTVGANYAIYVELGTRFMSARPAFYPAVEGAKDDFDSAISAIKDAIGGLGL